MGRSVVFFAVTSTAVIVFDLRGFLGSDVGPVSVIRLAADCLDRSDLEVIGLTFCELLCRVSFFACRNGSLKALRRFRGFVNLIFYTVRGTGIPS